MARYRVGLETRARITAATRELLGEVGLDGLTLKAITVRAGVGAGSFYNLFDSKEQVILEVIHEAITAVDPDPSGSGQDSLADLVAAFVRFVTEQEPVATIYLQLALAGGLTDDDIAARVRRSHRRRVSRFADAIAREHPELSPEQCERRAEGLLASLTGYALTTLIDPSFDLERRASELLAVPLR